MLAYIAKPDIVGMEQREKEALGFVFLVWFGVFPDRLLTTLIPIWYTDCSQDQSTMIEGMTMVSYHDKVTKPISSEWFSPTQLPGNHMLASSLKKFKDLAEICDN